MSTYQSEMWLMTAGGLVVAVLGICCKFAYKIKIIDCALCCGLISIKRDIPDELKAAAVDIENRSDDIPSPTQRLNLPNFASRRQSNNIPL